MSDDLISRSALLKDGIRGKYLVGADGSILIPVHCVRKYIKEAPAVDAVIPVRCKDCAKDGLTTCPICYIEKQTLQFINHDPDFFCGYGERRADHA